jgi:hypothetical protein
MRHRLDGVGEPVGIGVRARVGLAAVAAGGERQQKRDETDLDTQHRA